MSFRSALLRGGTSKGLFFHANDLPSNPTIRDGTLLRIMGSPDPTGMQMNGIGGGISSASKVAIISPSAKSNFDVNYLFGQVGLRTPEIDYKGSCGNLAAAVGLYAVTEGLVKGIDRNESIHKVKVWQENLGYEIVVHVPNLNRWEKDTSLNTSIGGIPGEAPGILVEFVDPNNGKSLLPTGNAIDELTLPNGNRIPCTLILSANPTIFVHASDIGLNGDELPQEIASTCWESLEPLALDLCHQGAEKMGISYSPAVRLSWLTKPTANKQYNTTSNERVSSTKGDLIARITTEGRTHHAFTGTGAINLACAAAIPGTIPNKLKNLSDDTTRIIHPGGLMEVTANVEETKGEWVVQSSGLIRTARYLFSGHVYS